MKLPFAFDRAARPAWTGAMLLMALGGAAVADDWPQWMGPQRDGIWRETGIVESFPTNGPAVLWRVPMQPSYCGPAVAGNRLFVMDRKAGKAPERKRGDRSLPQIPGNERLLCVDTRTGATLWEQAYDCPYRISYPSGPRATPLVDAGKVFTLGAMGDLRCHDAVSGSNLWSRQFLKDFSLDEPPVWGWSAHPLLDGEKLICTVGGSNSAIVAFHKDTGRELWRAVTTQEIGYAPPVLHTVHGRRQLIYWHPDGVVALDPQTGAALWTNSYPVGGKPQRPEVTIAMPRVDGERLFLTSFYQGSLLLEMPRAGAESKVLWNRRSTSKSVFNEGLHTTMGTPVIREGYIYGMCGAGELRCLDLKTGDRQWESFAVAGGKGGLFANAFFVENAGRWFIWNDQGELILGRLTPERFVGISRTKLLPTIESTRGRDVLWCHPAFAHKNLFVHNGRELIAVSLAMGRVG